MRRFRCLANSDGGALLYFVSVALVLALGSVVISKKNITQGEQGQVEVFKLNRDNMSNDLYTFFSDRNRCSQYFGPDLLNASFNGTTVGTSMALTGLEVNLKEDEKIQYPFIDLEVKELKTVSIPTESSSNIAKALTEVEYLIKGKEGTVTENLSTDESTPLTLPIVFEFGHNDGGGYFFYSCYAKDKTEFTSKLGCESIGGVFDEDEQNCRFEKRVFNSDTGSVVISQNQNLQDVLCNIEKDVIRQGQINHPVLNAAGGGIGTKICPAPEWNGCRLGNGPNEEWVGETHKFGGDDIGKYIEGQFNLSNAARFSRAIHVMDVTATSKVDPAERPSLGSSGTMGGMTAGALALGAGAGTYFAIGALAAHTIVKTVLIEEVVKKQLGGMVVNVLETWSFTSTSSPFAALGPWALGIAIAISVIVMVLMKCDEDRKLTPTYQCVNGIRELKEIRMEKEKFKCKSFSCGCKWRHEKTFTAMTIGEIAQSIVQGNDFSDIDFQVPPDDTGEKGSFEEIKKLLNDLILRLKGNSITVEEEQEDANSDQDPLTDPPLVEVNYPGVITIEDLYNFFDQHYDQGAGGYDFETFLAMDLDGQPTLSARETSIVNLVNSVKDEVLAVEKNKWNDNLINPVSGVSTKSALDGLCSRYLNNVDKIISFGNSTDRPVAFRNAVISRSLYSSQIQSYENAIDSYESQIADLNSDRDALLAQVPPGDTSVIDTQIATATANRDNSVTQRNQWQTDKDSSPCKNIGVGAAY